MLVVRQEQIETIIKSSEEDFVNYLVGYVSGKHSEIVSKRDDETLKQMMRVGIKRAERHDVTSVEDTEAFVSIMVEIAPNFDDQAQIKAVLDDKKIPPGERIEKLRAPIIPEEAWEEAKNNYDENAWFPQRTEADSSHSKSHRRQKSDTKK